MASDTKVDPWALLREARESVLKLADEYESLRLSVGLEQEQRDLVSRIDAALAAHEAEAPDSATPVVEWCAVGDTWATAYPVDGVEMTVMRWSDGPWKWWTKCESSEQGTAATEDEAKTAAIAAARGLR